jgi:ankyrin repeat protein
MAPLRKTAVSLAILLSFFVSSASLAAKKVKPKPVTQTNANALIIKRNYTTAFAVLSAQALKGDGKAQYKLAELYRLGLGTKKDAEAARQWFASAAKAGNAKAAYVLGRMSEVAPATQVKLVSDVSTNATSATAINFSKLPERKKDQPDWLTLAVARKNADVVTGLTTAKFIAPKTNPNFALVTATKNADQASVQKLMTSNVAQETDARGQTPLMLAVTSGDVELSITLLHSKSSLNATNQKGATAIELAAQNCQSAIFSKLIEAGAEAADKNASQHPLILIAQNCTNWPDFKRFFAGANFNAVDGLGRSAAWYAAAKGDTSLLAWLVDSGADLTIADNAGLSPLHSAAAARQPFSLRYILAKSDKVDLRSERGTTPLMLAAYTGCSECVTPLLEKSADMNLKNNDGDTSLMFAVRGQQALLAADLIKSGANMDARNDSGDSPAKFAEKIGLTILKGSSE